MKLRALVVDDEALGRRRMRRLLHEHADMEVVAECANGRDAIAAIRSHALDVVFLDVQMPGINGFEVVRAVGPEQMPFLVFVTAHADFALEAFGVEAIDYLVKPVSAERLAQTLRRVRSSVSDRSSAETGRRLHELVSQALDVTQTGEHSDAVVSAARIKVRQGERTVFVPVTDVDWFEADGNHIRAHAGTTVYTFRETVAGLEKSLNPAQFVRIHRSTILNLQRIRELEAWFGGDAIVVLHDGTRLRMSRTYRDQLKGRLNLL